MVIKVVTAIKAGMAKVDMDTTKVDTILNIIHLTKTTVAINKKVFFTSTFVDTKN